MLLAVTLLTLLGAIGLWSWARPAPRSLLLGAGVLAAAQITGSLILLGLVGQLNRVAVVAANVASSLLLIVATRKTLVPALRTALDSLRARACTLRRTSWHLIAAAVLLFAMLWTLVLGIILPPTDWDGLAQNLPMAAFHVQNGDIRPVETPYRGIRAYPQTGALWLSYTMLLSDDDTFVDLAQFPFWLLGTLAVYALARELGARRPNAFTGALLFAAAPVAILLARTAYFDLAVAALALASLALILDRSIGALPRALVAGAAAGLLAGLKYAGLIYAGVLLMLLAVLLVGERLPRRRLLAAVAGYAGLAVLLGGCWYVWNLMEFRNQLWPMHVQVGSLTLLPGVWTSTAFYEGAAPPQVVELPYLAGLVTLWREPTPRYAADVRLGGLGPLWFALGIPALLLVGWQTARRPTLARVVLLLFILATFLLTPANWHTRYVLASAGAAGACVAVMLEQFTHPLQTTLRGLSTALACLMFVMVPVHGAGSPADVVRNMEVPASLRRTVFMDDVPAMDDALRWAEMNIPTGSVIGYGWGGVILYPLFGPRLQNALYYYDATAGHAYDAVVVRADSPEAADAEADAAFAPVFASDAYLIFARTASE